MVHERGVLIAALAVAAAQRGKGIGTSLTAAAVNCAAERPATLNAATPVTGSTESSASNRSVRRLDSAPSR
jgi:GNAT superfamily N-acetyltransferase